MERDALVLNECPSWWNVETRDGFVCESFEDKRLARLYQKLDRRGVSKRATWKALRHFATRRAFVPATATPTLA
jgi:hypothetical protein